MPGPDRNYDDDNLDRVRKLRHEMSKSEKKLYRRISDKKLGYRFRRQYPIGPYVLDFYCPKIKLCVEVDGEQHLLTKEQDAKRDRFLETYGILTIRIPSLELFGENDMGSEAWANRLKEIADARWEQMFPGKKPPARRFFEN